MKDRVIRITGEQTMEGISEKQEENYVISANNAEANEARGFPTNYVRTTKYTLITFLPKNLFEQFRRVANIYFLIVIVIQFIPGITPTIPITSILPLAFVLTVSAIKEAIEDFQRYKEDQRNNKEVYKVIRGGELTEVESQFINAGDIVYCEKGRRFPSDMILLSSSSEGGICFVQTANLDGETNLKLRKPLKYTSEFVDPKVLTQLKGNITCQVPNEKLYQFTGRLEVTSSAKSTEPSVHSLDINNLLHRGAQLRNTMWIYGITVYVGHETKIFMNQRKAPSKFSTVEKQLNKITIAIFIFNMACCLAMAILSGVWDEDVGSDFVYVGTNPYNTGLYIFRNFLTYFILFNRMIPISLWVTMEIAKVGQAKFMEWDEQMAVEPHNTAETGMKAKTSNLNEDLGKIQHIFSDKTGTLTENQMDFWKCSINGVEFVERKPDTGKLLEAMVNPSTDPKLSDRIREFLLILSLCNSAVPEVQEGKIIYQSQSPDEVTLVETAADNGFELIRRSTDELVIKIQGREFRFKLLGIMEFSSARRRMSVVLETPEGRLFLLSKGADVIIYERLSQTESNRELRAQISQQLSNFSKEGLRTLVCAQREINRAEFSAWFKEYEAAINHVGEDRDDLVEKVCSRLESNLELIGATAIEDKLQDLVPNTIAYLLESGIKVWVLTGDKQETAINIGYSSRLLKPENMELVILNTETSEECGRMIRSAYEKLSSIITVHHHTEQKFPFNMLPKFMDRSHVHHKSRKSVPQSVELRELEEHGKSEGLLEAGVVIDGATLDFALKDHANDFLKLCELCCSVICCRVTPLQKALVVRMVKQKQKRVVLSIGDGANDVSMIQEAHIGVGIFGKEGTQAARASDYAIQRFKHLKRLLCVHGRYSYIRVTGMLQYFFYKNMMYTLSLLFYSFYTGYTGQTMYDSWTLSLWNLVFTLVPPFTYGLFEKDVDDQTIYRYPKLYRRMQRGRLFTYRTFMFWMVSAVWHAIVIYFGMLVFVDNDVISKSGRSLDLWAWGTISCTAAIFIVNLKIALETKTWNILVHIAIWGSIASYILYLTVYNVLHDISPNNMYYVFFEIVESASYYLSVLMMVSVALLPGFIIKYAKRQWMPKEWQVVQEEEQLGSSSEE